MGMSLPQICTNSVFLWRNVFHHVQKDWNVVSVSVKVNILGISESKGEKAVEEAEQWQWQLLEAVLSLVLRLTSTEIHSQRTVRGVLAMYSKSMDQTLDHCFINIFSWIGEWNHTMVNVSGHTCTFTVFLCTFAKKNMWGFERNTW